MNTSLLERCLTPVSIELRHAIWFLENETLDESQKKLAQYEVDNLKGIKADLEAAIAEQSKPSKDIFEVYEVWFGRQKFATYANREIADKVVGSTTAAMGGHVTTTLVLGEQAKPQECL